MSVNTNAPLFTIRLTGDEVRPHLIPASDLAQLLVAAEQTVMAIAARDRPDEADELIVGLSAVLDESIGFAFSSNHEETALSAYRELVTLTENRAFRSLPARAWRDCERLRVSRACMADAPSSGMEPANDPCLIWLRISPSRFQLPNINVEKPCSTARSNVSEECAHGCASEFRNAR